MFMFSSAFRSSKRSSNAIWIPSSSSSSSSFSNLYTNGFPLKNNSFSLSHPRSFSIKVSSSSTTIAEPEGIKITSVPTKPIEGQKTGTSGLRKRKFYLLQVKVFMEENYLSNWIQSLFNSLPPEDYKNGVLVLGGDGRYFNREASQIIIKIAAGNGIGKILVGRDGIMSTAAVSAANGGFIMSASHNPGGLEYGWGIKFNYNSGQPAPESITDKIYGNTLFISEIKMAEIPDIDLSHTGVTNYGNFTVEVIDPVSDYLELMETVFDFQLIKSLLTRSNFRFAFDAMHAVTGAYAKPIFVDKLEAHLDSISNGVPLEDFGHGHPDPNLTYAKDLVNTMYSEEAPDFGAASDGDCDRNMILGKKFFVTPPDSVAIIAANAQEAIPYFHGGPKGLAQSMPTSGALDRVAEKLGLTFFLGYILQTPWYFCSRFLLAGNLMDAGKLSICGEESFGTGSDHICEKDGIWAVLAWLSIIAYRNKDKKPGERLVPVSNVVKQHWTTYGRNFFSSYEECASEGANKMIEYLRDLASKNKAGEKYGNYVLQFADDFSYTDPVDGSVASKQGVRFVFTDGSRIIFRLSGTSSAGATFRIYIEQFEPDASKHDMDAQVALKSLIDLALSVSKLKGFTGREKPTVIT
ncbi:Phosphoglucomutase [Hibiscus syriacus]|uniref:phosphoglucomutase (alpha-D-glucose-1,6-bisphosphate-dependent) n=1 Tax=Hibiscus syriacus TaxID=106335 RepID=A0A6A2WW26_HIBSY|nr:Phosphoglucomutase [Hibiscus syriacus]